MKTPYTHRAFLALAVPNVLANLVVPLASLVDVAVLGHLDDIEPLAGVALATVVFDVIFFTLNFLRIGTTGLTAIAFGAGDKEASSAVFFRSFMMAMILGTLLIGLQFLYRDPALNLMMDDPAIFPAAQAYFSARIMGAPAALGNFVITGWLLGRQKPKSVLVITALLCSVNIFGDWLFVWKWGMGAYGAGLATMLATWLAFLVGLFLVRRAWGSLPAFRFHWLKKGFRDLLHLQVNIMVRTFCLTFTFAMFTYISGQLGTTILAANTVLERLLYSAAWFIDGYAFALEALAGRYWGAGNEHGVRRYLKVAMTWNLGTVLLLILLFLGLGPQIVNLLISFPDAAELAIQNIPWLCVTLCLAGFAYIYDGLYIGIAAGKQLRKAMMLSFGLGFLPLALWSLYGEQPTMLWAAMVGFMAVRVVSLGLLTLKPALGTGGIPNATNP